MSGAALYVGVPRHTCDCCGAGVFADGTKGGGYMTEAGVWVASWATCGTCCRKPDARPREVRAAK